MKIRLVSAAIISSSLLFGYTSHAEELRVPVGSDTQSWSGAKPQRGSTKAQVESQFGSPTSTAGPSGNPPIYYWEYADFTVYFENDHVIHTVVKNRKN